MFSWQIKPEMQSEQRRTVRNCFSILPHIGFTAYRLYRISALPHIGFTAYRLYRISALPHIGFTAYRRGRYGLRIQVPSATGALFRRDNFEIGQMADEVKAVAVYNFSGGRKLSV